MLAFPERFFTRTFLIRGCWLWLGCRLMLMAVGVAGAVSPTGRGPGVFAGSPFFLVMLPLAAGALGWLDAVRRNEDKFLMNLGVAPYVIAILSAVPAIAIELILLVAHA